MNDSHPLTLPEAVVRRRELQAALDASRRELQDRDAALAEARKDRASIVAFLAAETKRIDDAAERVDDEDHGVTGKRLRAQASIGRTWTAQIERGDDRQGGE